MEEKACVVVVVITAAAVNSSTKRRNIANRHNGMPCCLVIVQMMLMEKDLQETQDNGMIYLQSVFGDCEEDELRFGRHTSVMDKHLNPELRHSCFWLPPPKRTFKWIFEQNFGQRLGDEQQFLRTIFDDVLRIFREMNQFETFLSRFKNETEPSAFFVLDRTHNFGVASKQNTRR